MKSFPSTARWIAIGIAVVGFTANPVSADHEKVHIPGGGGVSKRSPLELCAKKRARVSSKNPLRKRQIAGVEVPNLHLGCRLGLKV